MDILPCSYPNEWCFFPCVHYNFISKCACVLTYSSSKSRELDFKLLTALLGSFVAGCQSKQYLVPSSFGSVVHQNNIQCKRLNKIIYIGKTELNIKIKSQ